MYCPYRIGGLNHDTDWITTGTYHYTVGIQSCRDWVRFPDCITTCNRVYFNKQVEWTVSGTPHIVLQIRFACYHYQAHWCDRITSAMWSATWSRTADVRVYPDGSGLTWTLSPTVRSRRLWSWYSDSQHCDERLARNLSEELLVSLQKGPLETPTDGGTGCWLRGWRLSYPEFVPTDTVDMAWRFLKPTLPSDMMTFARYYEDTWIGTSTSSPLYDHHDATQMMLPTQFLLDFRYLLNLRLYRVKNFPMYTIRQDK